MRRALLATVAALSLIGTAQAQLFPLGMYQGSGVGPSAANTMTVSDASGVGEANYPLQFGRPFLKGAIPHAPQVLVNGSPVATQADIKNRYPDGSVEFAVIAVVLPSIPASGSLTLTFQDQTAPNNTPLTQAQMLDPSYNFDAVDSFTGVGQAAQTVSARTMLTNGDYKLWTSGPIAQTVMLGDDSTAAKYDVGFGDGHHPVRPRFYATFWPATHQVFVRAVGENDKTTEVEDAYYQLGINAGSTSPAQVYSIDLDAGRDGTFAGGVEATLTVAAAETSGFTGTLPTTGTPSAALTANGEPSYALTPEGEFLSVLWNNNTQTLSLEGRGAINTKTAALNVGDTLLIGYPKAHYAFTDWTQRFWLGGAPQDKVNIDNNLAYLESTRYLPNYDTSIKPESIAASYAATFAALPNDFMDAGYLFNDKGGWNNVMSNSGAEPFIAPYPQWTVLWMYTGDYRLRDIALKMADNAGAYPMQLRETDPTRRLLRSDAQGCNPCDGLGRAFSTTDRRTLVTQVFGYSATTAADNINFVGAVDETASGNPWSWDEAHQPAAFYPQYILTGDPWYLDEMYQWAAFTQGRANGADTGDAAGKGPDGSYGGIDDQLRGAAWGLRNRAEAAFAAPDGDPEKTYFTYLTNDALARWEGSFGITGTAYDGTAIKVWGAQTGNYFTAGAGAQSGQVPLLGNWESAGNPNGSDGTVQGNISGGIFQPTVGSYTTAWNHEYLTYALGRVKELGFASDALRVNTTSKFFTGMINNSGYPQLIGMYEMPTASNCMNTASPPACTFPPGGFYETWPATVAAITTGYLTGNGWNEAGNDGQGWLVPYFQSGINDPGADGRPIYLMGGLAMMVDNGDPGAAQAWTWYNTNVRQLLPAGAVQYDPKWTIVPRTDSNALPAQSTAVGSGPSS